MITQEFTSKLANLQQQLQQLKENFENFKQTKASCKSFNQQPTSGLSLSTTRPVQNPQLERLLESVTLAINDDCDVPVKKTHNVQQEPPNEKDTFYWDMSMDSQSYMKKYNLLK